MTKSEFLDNLKEDKWFDIPQELIDHRLPVVEFYWKNYVNAQVILNGHLYDSKSINIAYFPEDFILVNKAYNSLRERYDKGEIV